MKASRILRNLALSSVLGLGVWGLLSLSSCSDSSTGSNGNPTPRLFSSGDLTPGSPGESFSYVFNSAMSIGYYCRHHGGPGGVGMSGVITVSAGGSPSKTSVSITTSTLPDLTIDVGDTITWTNNHVNPYPTVHTVESDN